MGQEDSRPAAPSAPLAHAPPVDDDLVGTAVAGITVLVMQQLSWLIDPVFLALVTVILVYPVDVWMLRHEFRRLRR
jgi:hypothetical protein